MPTEPMAEVRVRMPMEMAEAIESLARLAAVPADHVVGIIIALYLMPWMRKEAPTTGTPEENTP